MTMHVYLSENQEQSASRLIDHLMHDLTSAELAERYYNGPDAAEMVEFGVAPDTYRNAVSLAGSERMRGVA